MIPSIWKSVPIEPTEKMLKAASDAEFSFNENGTTSDIFRQIYRVMLNAAPSPLDQPIIDYDDGSKNR